MNNKIVLLILLFGNLTSAFELPKYPNQYSRDLNGMIKKFYLESKRVVGFYYFKNITLRILFFFTEDLGEAFFQRLKSLNNAREVNLN